MGDGRIEQMQYKILFYLRISGKNKIKPHCIWASEILLLRAPVFFPLRLQAISFAQSCLRHVLKIFDSPQEGSIKYEQEASAFSNWAGQGIDPELRGSAYETYNSNTIND